MEKETTSKSLDHLGLVAGMIDELQLVETIDSKVAQSLSDRHISIGLGVKAMLINGLGFTQRTLYMVSSFYENLPVELLLGAGVRAQHLNDSVLGRILDEIHAYGCTKLYGELAPVICQRLNLRPTTLCMDSTDFHVDGKYNSETGVEPDARVIHITRGYSRDHRPDLNQAVLNLIVENQAGIVLNMQAHSGNVSDKTIFRDTISKYISQLQSTYEVADLLMDSAGYTKETIETTGNSVTWISRVPETLTEAQAAIASTELVHYLSDGYQYRMTNAEYGGVAQRWAVIHSEEAFAKEVHTLHKNFVKQTNKAYQAFEKLCQELFSCRDDAEKQMKLFCKKYPILELADTSIVSKPHFTKKGRPSKDEQPSHYSYQIQGQCAFLIAEYRKAERPKGKFIIATNNLDTNKLPDNELLQKYKSLSKVERGFRFLKDPQFVASSFFVKKPERVEALLFLMTLSLSVYAAIEFKARQQLEKQNKTLPNQLNKQVKNPTARWLFALLAGIHVLYLPHHKPSIINFNETKIKIIDLLGEFTQKYYFRI